MIEPYRFIDYEAAKEAQARGEKEWGHVGAYDVDPTYRGRGLQREFQVDDPGESPRHGPQPSTTGVQYIEWEERLGGENMEHYSTLTQYYSDKEAPILTTPRPDFWSVPG